MKRTASTADTWRRILLSRGFSWSPKGHPVVFPTTDLVFARIWPARLMLIVAVAASPPDLLLEPVKQRSRANHHDGVARLQTCDTDGRPNLRLAGAAIALHDDAKTPRLPPPYGSHDTSILDACAVST